MPGTHDRRRVAVLIPLLAASGATSLVYETAWARHLHHVFGTSQLAVSSLLAVVMGGLALGAIVAGRWTPRMTRPLAVYGGLEAFVAAHAVLVPTLIALATPIYLGVARIAGPGSGPAVLAQLLVSALVLLPPTMAMGATLPVAVRAVAAGRTAGGGRIVGTLYGANTLGAVIGAALGGFVLLPAFGVTMTTWLASGVNIVIAALALVASRRLSLPRHRAA